MTNPKVSRLRYRLAWGFFLSYLAVWTTFLLAPAPFRLLKMLLFGSSLAEKVAMHGHRDKLAHFLGYLLLMVVAVPLLSLLSSTPFRRGLFFVFGFGVVHGGVVEILQHLGKVRTGDFWDWIADIVGLLAATFAIEFVRCWKSNREPILES